MRLFNFIVWMLAGMLQVIAGHFIVGTICLVLAWAHGWQYLEEK